MSRMMPDVPVQVGSDRLGPGRSRTVATNATQLRPGWPVDAMSATKAHVNGCAARDSNPETRGVRDRPGLRRTRPGRPAPAMISVDVCAQAASRHGGEVGWVQDVCSSQTD
jgi:hypothetical protein